MRLLSLTIRDFRKLARSWHIGPLEPQLTVIGGDNEEGKSTVLLALKAALFESWSVSGSVGAAMRSHTGGTPRIEVAFELGGTSYRLEKEFGRSCLLSWSNGRLSGDEAEAKLQQLLRFERRSGRADRQAKHLGLFALFWVDQGTSFVPEMTVKALEPQRDRILAALRREIELVAGGPRLSALRAHIKANCARFFTERGEEKRAKDSPLVALREQLSALEAEIAQLQALRRTYDATVDRLEDARAALARARDPQRRAEAEARAAQARDELQRLDDLERAYAQQHLIVQREEAELKRIESELRARERRREQLERAQAELIELQCERTELEKQLKAAEQQCLEREREQSRLAEEAANAHARLVRAQRARAVLERRDHVQRLRDACNEIERTAQAVRRIEAELAEITVDQDTVEKLRAAAQKVAEKAAVLNAQATRIEFFPTGERGVRRLDGSALDLGRPLDLTEPTELVLEGFGRIRITPGGDLAAAQRAVEEAQRRLDELLARARVPTLEAAEAALSRRNARAHELMARTEQIAALLRSLGVEDGSALRARLEEEEQKLGELQREFEEDNDAARLLEQEHAIEEEVRICTARIEKAREEARRAGQICAELRQRWAAIDGQYRTQLRTLQELREAELADHARISDADLKAEYDRTAARLTNARAQLGAIEAEREGLDPQRVRDRAHAAERELQKLEQELVAAQREVDRLEGELKGLGLEACDARLEELERRRAELVEQKRSLERESKAWKLLWETLVAHERRITESLLEPAERRFRPYLEKLFPDAELVLDQQSLLPAKLRREGIDEPLSELSVGTREQLAVLVRLALADLLLEHEGEAPCLVLDDALVFSDEARFARIKRILAEASNRMQILVLTCRPREWADLSARYLRLEDCRLKT